MKIYYAVFFGISVTVGIACFIYSCIGAYKLKRAASNLIGVSCFTAVVYMVSLLTNSYNVMRVSHCIYFAMMDWLCLALFFFVLCFTGRTFDWKKLLLAVLPVTLLDFISQIANIWYGHSVGFRGKILKGDIYFSLEPHIPFYLHLVLCYVFVTGALALLVVGTVKSVQTYRIQYINVLGILAFIVTCNAFFLIVGLNVDVSIIAYSIGGWILYYYTRFYMARQLTLRMSGILLNHMRSTVILFDSDGETVYHNETSMHSEFSDVRKRDELVKILGLRDFSAEKDYKKEVIREEKNSRQILDVEYCVFYEADLNKKEQNIGSYFQIEDTTAKREKLIRREYLASHDALTGLYNRGYFCERAKQLIKEHEGEEYAVLMTDLSQFKVYNEIFGRAAGDELLKNIAGRIRNEIRGNQAVYGHYEADRFVVCLPYTYCTMERLSGQGFLKDISTTNFQLGSYTGICKVTDPTEDIAVLCERAAIAVNTIKGDASRRVAFYDSEMKESVLWEQELAATFPKALKNGEIVLFVQPQFNQKTMELIGGEVLARWITPAGEMISPGRFIPVLEKNGQITKMDMFIWEQACHLAAQFLDNGKPVALSVNISGQDFFRCDVAKTFVDLIGKYDLPPEYLKLEITESEMITDIERTLAVIEELRNRGFIVEMDDFGSGYSSLNSLKDIPVDVLKMDMMFFKKRKYQAGEDVLEKGKFIIRNVVRLAEDLGIPVIAEGVENEEQAEFLADINCNYIQGFLYGRPMPVREFEELRKEKEYGEMV